jgi:hypothetical protein
MNHLSRVQLLDIVEGHVTADDSGVGAAVRRHLDGCDACRARAAALRATLAEAQRDAGAEPSPLFWDHFAARVSAAIREEPRPAPVPAGWWIGRPASAWIPVAILVALALTTVARHATLHAPAPGAGVAGPASAAHDGPAATDALESDEAWSSVRAAADGMVWDEAQEAGISAAPGAVERAATELTPEERTELGRLLEAEMKRSGA